MNHLHPCLLGALSSLFAASLAGAFPVSGPELPAIATSSATQQHIVSVAENLADGLGVRCTAAHFRLDPPLPISPLPRDPEGHLATAAWRQAVREQGCGKPRVFNTLTVLTDQARTVPLLPGNTHADELLQHEAVPVMLTAATTALGEIAPTCSKRFVLDTEFVGHGAEPSSGKKAADDSWREVWTVVLCNQQARVRVTFSPDSTGTKVLPGPASTIKLESRERFQ